MFPFEQILWLLIRGSLSVLWEPLFWMMLALVGYQYWQLQRNQIRMFGFSNYTLKNQLILAGVYGLAGGLFGSFLLTGVGLTLNQIGLSYIWPVAIALMLVHMRFLCFAYAGGLVALSSALLGWPQVNIPHVIALVAILHITESILIFISGRYSAVPLIMQRDDGRLIGAFSLQNFWPLPLVLLAAVAVPEAAYPDSGVIKMPDWWPLLPLNLDVSEGHRWIYTIMPVVAALGYSDVAIASSPAERRRRSAFHLLLYSMVLLALALLAARYPWLQTVAALASPFGHELLIQLDNRREFKGVPRFVPPPQGVMILDTVVDSPARRVGLKAGDIITQIDEYPVNSGFELARALNYVPTAFTVHIERQAVRQSLPLRFAADRRMLGVILVPEGHEQQYVTMANERLWLFDWLKRKFNYR